MSGPAKKLDLIAVGRAAIDLYGDQIGGRLEDMASFSKYIGGSPANTAIGLSRLGLRSGMLTRVGGDHFGRFVSEQLSREGVDIGGVRTDGARLTGLAVLGIRDQDTFPLIFFRENCADMALEADDVDEAYVSGARSVLVNGTHLSRPAVYDASRKVCEIAKRNGGKVVFDIDYRPVLWGLTTPDMGENRFVSHAAVTQKLQTIAPLCDLIVGTEEEVHILGGTIDTLEALRVIRGLSDALIVLKRGSEGCVCYEGAIPDSLDGGITGPAFEVDVFNVLGAGDAFMAGFLRGWLEGLALPVCCQFANACGAIVVSRHGCAPAMATWTELQDFLGETQRPFRLREDARLENVHWSTTRYPDYPELKVLAIDHRSQLEEIAQEVGGDVDRVSAFKSLALKAVDLVSEGRPGFGVLLDGRFGARALEAAADRELWIGRPIERPGSRPLEFENVADVGSALREWPSNHCVKCLVFYHPDDEPQMRQAQEEAVIRLFEASRKTGHELLLEVIASTVGKVKTDTISRTIQRFYDLGVRPDWWKLEPAADAATWRSIETTINANDPLCRGVVLLGLAATDAALLDSFKTAATFPIVKGFAVGRTIWAEPARLWLSDQMTDDQAVQAMAGNFAQLVSGWNNAKNQTRKTSAA
jgi:5-dehydro-2-deoxygluconokinase